MQTKLPELRRQQRLTQEDLAREMHVTRQTILSIENGKYTASLLLAHRLSKFFGLSIEEVFDFSEKTE